MDFIDVPLSGTTDRLYGVDANGTSTVAFAKRLQRLLVDHDNAVTQIQEIDSFINRTKNNARRAMLLGHKGRALHYMSMTSTAAGIKIVYQRHRAQRWYQIQRLVALIMRTMEPTETRPSDVIFHWEGPGDGDEQMKKYSHTMMVSQCNFTRFS